MALSSFDESVERVVIGTRQSFDLPFNLSGQENPGGYKEVQAEVYEAVGFSLHQTFDSNALREAHLTLAAIRKFVCL